MLDFDIEALGLKKADIEAIRRRFLCRISLEDWESMMLFKDTEGIFKYLFIENEDSESLIDTLLEMGKISVGVLREGQPLMEYMIETHENVLKLTDGKWVIFNDELLRKETLAQID